MCSVVTNLMTSLEFKPMCCATMLCHFGRTRDGYVATRFILLSCTADSSAASGHVVVPERFGQSEARAGRKVERSKKKLSYVPCSGSFVYVNIFCVGAGITELKSISDGVDPHFSVERWKRRGL